MYLRRSGSVSLFPDASVLTLLRARFHSAGIATALTLFVAAVLPAIASAAPVWNLDLHHNQTNFVAGSGAGATIQTITEGQAPTTDEVQRLTVRGIAGSYRVGFAGGLTADLDHDASPATVQAELEALAGIGAGNVSVSGGPGDLTGSSPYLITFQGALAASDVAELATASPAPTGGNSPLGGSPQYWFEIKNVGDSATVGPTTVTVELPAGVTGNHIEIDRFNQGGSQSDWSCSSVAGASTVTCTSADIVPRHRYTAGPGIAVNVDPGASGVLTATATVSGGGAVPAPPVAACPPVVGACAAEPTQISATPAPFGIVPASFRPDFYEADGITPVRQAGAHPSQAVFPFDFNSIDRPIVSGAAVFADKKVPNEPVRDLRVDLPPGFLGDPTAVAECPPSQLVNGCPKASQVGILDFTTIGDIANTAFQTRQTAVYNLAHPRGIVTDLAFVIAGNPVHVRASLDPARNYAITTTVSNINETFPVFHQRLTIWGVPADPAHDSERCGGVDTAVECSSGAPRKAFLTVPFDCATPTNQMKLSRYDSWEHPGIFGPDLTYDLPGRFTGCDQPRFEANVSVQPTDARADSPTGLAVTASIPQNANPNGVAAPPVKHIEVKLPDGMSFNPAFADGLAGCSPAQIGLKTDDPVRCPDSSRIGSVEISTPVLPKPLEGAVYLAQQSQNPFGSLFAMYVVAQDTEDRGVLVKIPGRIDLDPSTGQITTVFDDLPQLPFDHLTASIRGGDRAPLVNPSTCGVKTVAGVLNTWSQPDVAVPVSSSYTVTRGPDGGACAPDLGARPFAPGFAAGTQQPTAGAFSPFSLKLTRKDGEQELTKLQADLPTGLTAKLAGVAQCSDAAIAAISTAPGSGQGEIDRPSCPAASKIGYVHAGAGSGPRPYYITGSVYLAGPYQGAPFSAVVVTPAVAGSVDLGSVVLRTKLTIDPDDAQVHVDSGAIPTIIHGVPIHLRDVRVVIDRPDFMLNPTSCVEKQFTGFATAITGLTAPIGDRFQVGDCAGLNLAPKLNISLTGKGQTTDNKHPGVHATVSQPAGQANLKKVVVSLPLSLALDPDNAQALCEFTDGSKVDPTCPKGSIVGKVVARTPILNQPLTGPVYFVKNVRKDPKSGREIRTLPKLVIPLTGENGLRLNLVGTSNVVKNRLVSTFDNIPDAPVSDFTLDIDGGKSGILVVSGTDICKASQVAEQQIDGHNGKTADTDIYLQTPGCPLKILSKKVGKTSVAIKISGLSAGKVTVTGKGIKKTTKTIAKSTVATITAKRTKGKPGKVKVSFDPTGPAKARKTTK